MEWWVNESSEKRVHAWESGRSRTLLKSRGMIWLRRIGLFLDSEIELMTINKSEEKMGWF